VLSLKLTVQLRLGLVWQLLLLLGEHAPRKPWPPSNATSSRPLPTTRWRGWHANSCVPLRCWSGSTVSCGASFVKSAALAVRKGLKWPSIYRSSDSMLAGRSRLGGRPPACSTSTFSLSTLSQRYATPGGTLLTNITLLVIL